MEVNLFDSNFVGSNCSIAYQTPKHITCIRDQQQFNGITIFTDEWVNHPIVSEVKCPHKIGWLREPFCLHPNTYERSLDNLGKFSYILTYYKPFLRLDPRYRFAPYGGTWLPESEWGIKPKSHNISMLIGDKITTKGHQIRQEIGYANRYSSIHFYGNQGTRVDYSWQTKLRVLSSYRFSIITETCREDNLFTEWLLDAFMLGTVPIYWGCKNMDMYFNTLGTLPFSNLDEVNDIIKALSNPGVAEYTYQDMLPAIKDNLQLAKEYAITEDWLYLNCLKDME